MDAAKLKMKILYNDMNLNYIQRYNSFLFNVKYVSSMSLKIDRWTSYVCCVGNIL